MKQNKLKNLIALSASSFFLMTTKAFALTYTPGELPTQPAGQPAQQTAAPQAAPAQAQTQTALQQQLANPWKLPPDVLDVVRSKGQAALLRDPNNSYVLQEIGIFLLFGDQNDAALGEQLLQRAIQLNQDNPQIVDKLTQFIQIAGPTGIQTADQMRRFFEVVVKYSPNDANSYAQLAAVYQLGGEGLSRDFKKAKELYEQALGLDPNNKIALLGLANILKQGGDGVSVDTGKANDLLTRYQQLSGQKVQAPAQAQTPTTQGPLPQQGALPQQGTAGQPQPETPPAPPTPAETPTTTQLTPIPQ